MTTSRQLRVTLPTAMADAVSVRVASGRYADESDVLREGLRALADQERAVEAWLIGTVAESFDAVDRETATFLTAKELRSSFGLE